jgi:hypothetical protein
MTMKESDPIRELNRLWEPVRPYLARQVRELYGRQDGSILEVGPFSGLTFELARRGIGDSFHISEAGRSGLSRRRVRTPYPRGGHPGHGVALEGPQPVPGPDPDNRKGPVVAPRRGRTEGKGGSDHRWRLMGRVAERIIPLTPSNYFAYNIIVDNINTGHPCRKNIAFFFRWPRPTRPGLNF